MVVAGHIRSVSARATPYPASVTYGASVEPDLPPSGRRPRWPWCPPTWARGTVGAIVSAAVGAAIIAVITIGGSFGAQTHQRDVHHLNLLGVSLLVLGCAALLLRRRYPVATLLIAATAVATYFALGYTWGPAFLPLVVAVFAAILAGYRLLAWITCGVAYLIIVWSGYLVPTAHTPAGVVDGLTTAAWPLVILVSAEVMRAGRERAVSAARGRAELDRRRASEERLRIAQELHDVLAHNISLISVQAGVALHLMDERPEEASERARTALTAIRYASKEALGELRSVLGLLRTSAGEQPPLSPVPGMAQLGDLTSRATAAGLTVRTETTGEPRPLPAGTDLAAYRIVQEALTNVIRHAGAANVAVRVSYGDTSLGIDVEDDGSAVHGKGSVEARRREERRGRLHEERRERLARSGAGAGARTDVGHAAGNRGTASNRATASASGTANADRRPDRAGDVAARMTLAALLTVAETGSPECGNGHACSVASSSRGRYLARVSWSRRGCRSSAAAGIQTSRLA